MQHALIDTRRARGLVSVRNDGNPAELIGRINNAFEQFKQDNDARLKGIEKKFDDVVQSEKVDRINADISSMQDALNQLNASLAVMRVGSASDDQLSPEKREYAKAFDRFFRRGIENNLRDLEVKAAVRSDSDPDGGYTVPEQLESTIDRVLATVSAMRGEAQVMSISTGTYKKLVGQGGTSSGWVGQRESRSETNTSTLSQLEFPAMELYANPAATQTLLDDSAVNIEEWLASEVAIEFAEEEGAAFVSGTGINQPRGFLSYDTVADASYSWGKLGFIVTGEAADFIAEDPVDPFINLVYALKQGYRQNAKWIMNKASQAKVRKFKDDSDNYMWTPPFMGGVQVAQPATFLGYPIIDDDNMSSVGANAFPVAFGDFRRGYLIVDRVGVRVLRDPFTNKPYVHFYTTKRVGGGVQNFEAIKLLKCST